MLQPITDADPNSRRIVTRITKEAFELLEAEAKRREQEDYRPCPVNSLLNEIILKVLRPKRPERGRPPKVQPKPVRGTKRIEGKTA